VLDSNVLLPALFAPGLCESLLDLLLESDECVLVVSEYILDEIREHATKKFGVPKAEIDAAISLVTSMAEVVIPVKLPATVFSDPDDLPVLGTALAGKADVLITGDGDLLKLKQIQEIPILSPRALLEQIG
jgi:putative PIN family toxin of toxin-antitoxin system